MSDLDYRRMLRSRHFWRGFFDVFIPGILATAACILITLWVMP